MRQKEINYVLNLIRLKLHLIFLLKYFLKTATIVNLVFGSILIINFATGSLKIFSYWLYILTTTYAIIFIYIWYSMKTKLPEEPSLLALLDAKYEYGGLLSAMYDAELGGWESKIESLAVPNIKFNKIKALFPYLISSIFLTGILFFPEYFPPPEQLHTLDISSDTEELANQIDVLHQEQIINKSEAKRLKKILHNIENEAVGESPLKTWESIDHLKNKLADKAKEESGKILRKTKQLCLTEKLAKNLQQNLSAFNSMKQTEKQGLASELSKLFNKIIAENPELTKMLSKQALKDLQCGKLSDKLLRELMKNTAKCNKKLLKKLKQLCRARLINAKLLKKCRQCCNISNVNKKELMLFLSENCNQTIAQQCILCFACPYPAKGAISRGRGDAPMLWKQKNRKGDEKFKDIQMKNNIITSLKNSRLIAVTTGAPEENKKYHAVIANHLGNIKATGDFSNKQRILPEHKHSVEKYFNRED